VRSPDDLAPVAASGPEEDSSSSLSGMERLLPNPEDDQSGKKRKLSVKEPSHQEAPPRTLRWAATIWTGRTGRRSLTLRVGNGADRRIRSLLGLAEAEHHLGNFADAKTHYLKLLDYDPTAHTAGRRVRS